MYIYISQDSQTQTYYGEHARLEEIESVEIRGRALSGLWAGSQLHLSPKQLLTFEFQTECHTRLVV